VPRPTADRANENSETALRTFVPISGAAAEGIIQAAASRYRMLARCRRQLGRIVALSFLPEPEREGGELAGER
jgi:hypothetical protein